MHTTSPADLKSPGQAFRLAVAAVLLLLGIALSSCSGTSANGKTDKQAVEAVPVSVANVAVKDMPVQIRTIGTVESYSTVSIKAMVSGQLKTVHFREGQDVKKGDLLFTIDTQPFQADLQKAQANLARDTAAMRQAEANRAKDQAQASTARVQASRYNDMVTRGIVSREQYDQIRTSSEALEATVSADTASIQSASESLRADKAAIETARINLSYCTIRSPLAGRTGSLLVHEGNLVKANDTPALIVINQIDPIYVTFSVPENQLPDIKRYMAAGKLRMEASIPNDQGPPLQGTISFVDNSVDNQTGTIKLKGTFDNRERRLWPGQFVNVTLTLTTQTDAIVVPSNAVQTGQQGQYVFVVNSDQTVEMRQVKVARAAENETVLEQGVKAGEHVVTDGQMRLVPGVRVEVKSDQQASEGAHQ